VAAARPRGQFTAVRPQATTVKQLVGRKNFFFFFFFFPPPPPPGPPPRGPPPPPGGPTAQIFRVWRRQD